jgi:arginyl-tRNA synthetase
MPLSLHKILEPMNLTSQLQNELKTAFNELFSVTIEPTSIKIERTRREFDGDFTINVFPFLKQTKKSPQDTARILGEWLLKNSSLISEFSVLKGFLNINIEPSVWHHFMQNSLTTQTIAITPNPNPQKIVLEYSSPNTNKPLHLGHIRNNLLGHAIAEILKAVGHSVIKVNLVNDRGIHICKSMLAWQKWGNGITPEKAGKKGDKLVGDFYVLFDKKYKEEIASLMSSGLSEKEAEQQSTLMQEARTMLTEWEQEKPDVVELWKMMNNWVYDGFEVTYRDLGITFDKIYYESQTYKTGKTLIEEGVKNGVFIKKEDGSVWADLTQEGLDEKLLLRADGTSVYITQDIGTFYIRNNDYNANAYLYVVGNEQQYHFQVLTRLLNKINLNGDRIKHISYGMVNLPHGKMKSREGTVVDADELIADMIAQAGEKSEALGKLSHLTDTEKQTIYEAIGLGALKYFILKVDARKDMLFNPEESIDFEGNTAPFIQYTYTRINSLFRKIESDDWKTPLTNTPDFNKSELDLLKDCYEFSKAVNEAARTFNPAGIANYAYNLAKNYNKYYQEYKILKTENPDTKHMRLQLSQLVVITLHKAMTLLGIKLPTRM